MILELFEDTVKMVFIVLCLQGVLREYVRLRRPAWSRALERRRLAILAALILSVLAIKVTEDVLGGESGPIDKAILVFIHAQVSTAWTAAFKAITLSGSASVLAPGIAAVTVILLFRQHRHEAFLLAASAAIGSGLVYVVKAWVGRERPALWPSEWYAGSSFPSGHTLVVAATAAACVLATMRLRPACGTWAIGAALVWTVLVGLSRLVLGVHWPTDVLAAACIGAAIPLVLALVLAFGQDGSNRSTH
jgi:undecaprenyl-diphosphatase